MTTNIAMNYNSDKECWEVTLDNETYFVEVPEAWESTALALASCAYAGFDLEGCFSCCEYDFDNHTIYYEV